MFTAIAIATAASALLLGENAPNFQQKYHDGTKEGVLDLYEYAGDSWVLLFSHPGDFTPICTTELGKVAQMQEEWDKRNIKPIALSVDSVEDHVNWIPHINEFSETEVRYPILADEDRLVSELYQMIHPDADNKATVRSVFAIDPEKKIRLTITYPPAIGRNFDEVLRYMDALQLSDEFEVATPVNWVPGGDVVLRPECITEEAEERLDQEIVTKYPYLRLTADPKCKEEEYVQANPRCLWGDEGINWSLWSPGAVTKLFLEALKK